MSRTPTRSRKHRADTPSTSSGALLILVAIVAFALRAFVAMRIGALPLSRTPQYDALEYLMWARRIAAGDFTWPTNPPHGPAYPFFLGSLLAIGGGSLTFVRIVQSFAGAATCFVAGRIASRKFALRGGVITAALLTLYAPLIWIDVSIASEGLLMLLLAFALWSAIGNRHPVLIGVLTGLAALTRPTALIFLPLFMWLSRKSRVAIAAAAIAVIIPVTIANWHASHALIPIQAFGGMNIYLGNSPLRDGKASARPGAAWESIEPQAARDGARGIAAEDAYFIRKTREEIVAHPAEFGGLLMRKSFWTLQNEEVRDTHSFYFFPQLVPLLRFLPGFTILFALAVAGAVMAPWRDRDVRAIAVYVLLAAVTCVFLVVGSRYRIPMVLGLAIFAGNLQLRKNGGMAAAFQIGLAVVAALLTRIAHDPASHDVSEEWALSAASLLKEDKLAEAEDAAKQALAIDASSALAWDKLGAIYGASNRGTDAEHAFRRAVAINPDYATAHEHLGLVLAQADDVRGALAEYQRAVALDPRDAKALLGLARLNGALGRSAEGLSFAQRAAELQPLDDDGWLLIAMLAADTRRFDIADDALMRVDDATRANAVREMIRARHP